MSIISNLEHWSILWPHILILIHKAPPTFAKMTWPFLLQMYFQSHCSIRLRGVSLQMSLPTYFFLSSSHLPFLFSPSISFNSSFLLSIHCLTHYNKFPCHHSIQLVLLIVSKGLLITKSMETFQNLAFPKLFAVLYTNNNSIHVKCSLLPLASKILYSQVPPTSLATQPQSLLEDLLLQDIPEDAVLICSLISFPANSHL